jgi:hypothetical protein
MSVFMQPIYTQTVGAGGATSITFNNIPQGYTDLKIVMSVRTTAAAAQWDNAAIVFNGDTSFKYSSTLMFGSGSTAGTNRDSGARGGLYATNLTQANTFGNIELNIFKYSSASFKTFEASSIQGNNTATSLPTLGASVWASTAPITSITLSSGSGATILQHSSFTLYGTGVQFSGGTPTAPTIGSVTDQAGFVSVAFTPATNDQSSSYAVTSTPGGVTTYGASSPIVTPAAVDTSYVYQVSGVNDRGTSASANSSAITTTNSYSSIASQTVGAGGAATINFTNIPQNYSHLQIRMYGFSSSQDTIVQINGDATAANYSRYYFYGNGTAVTSSGTISGGNSWVEPMYSSGNTTYAASSVSDILDYSSPVKAKVMRTLSAYDNNGTGFIIMYGNSWTGLAPITYLSFASLTGTFNQYTSIAIYGMA